MRFLRRNLGKGPALSAPLSASQVATTIAVIGAKSGDKASFVNSETSSCAAAEWSVLSAYVEAGNEHGSCGNSYAFCFLF